MQHPLVIGANCFLSGVTNSLLELQVTMEINEGCAPVIYYCYLSSQAPDLSPVLSIPDGVAVQEIKVTMGTAQKCFHLDVGVVYGINDILTVCLDWPVTVHQVCDPVYGPPSVTQCMVHQV